MKYALLFLTLCFSISVFGQVPYRTDDKKAIKYFEDAQYYLGKYDWASATERLELALERDSGFLDAKILLAEIHQANKRKDEAIGLMREVVAEDPLFYPEMLLSLSKLLLQVSEYEEARKNAVAYLSSTPPTEGRKRTAQEIVSNCDFALEAIKHPVPFEPQNLGPEVNSKYPEYFPCLTVDQSLLLFTRQTPTNANPEGYDEDFYFSEKKEGAWTRAYNPGPPINSSYKEGAPTLSPDGKFIIFTACELFGQYGKDKRGYGSCDLFISERIGNAWSKPRNLGVTVNSPNWETQPSFSSDGKTLYFIRGKRTRQGIKDANIYVTVLEDGRWSAATPLPDHINTNKMEESVFIHPDNQTLYFSSEGHPGMGGMDIYVSRKQEDGSWGQPENLGYPINTGGQENSLHVAADGRMALIASDRPDGYGELDLYSFELPESARPVPVTFLRGTISDAKTKRPLEAKFEVIDLETGETVVQSYSNQGNGKYLVSLPANKTYALNVNRTGYLFHSENFELVEQGQMTYFEIDIELQPIETGRAVVLKNVFFDTDSYELKPRSKSELLRLVELMNANPTLRIEVGGHTDSDGSIEANETLSENRAKSVKAFLVSNGIDASRIEAKGYGEAQPIATNETAKGKAQNRRTEFKVID